MGTEYRLDALEDERVVRPINGVKPVFPEADRLDGVAMAVEVDGPGAEKRTRFFRRVRDGVDATVATSA